jgi:predicted ester cyclase
MSLDFSFDRGALRREPVHADFRATVFGTTKLDWPGFVGFGEAFRDAFPNGKHVFDFVIAEGDCVATIGHYRGRHERAFMGVAPTGREVDFAVMHVDRVQAGRIVEHVGMGDSVAMWAQLGVTPPSV